MFAELSLMPTIRGCCMAQVTVGNSKLTFVKAGML